MAREKIVVKGPGFASGFGQSFGCLSGCLVFIVLIPLSCMMIVSSARRSAKETEGRSPEGSRMPPGDSATFTVPAQAGAPVLSEKQPSDFAAHTIDTKQGDLDPVLRAERSGITEDKRREIFAAYWSAFHSEEEDLKQRFPISGVPLAAARKNAGIRADSDGTRTSRMFALIVSRYNIPRSVASDIVYEGAKKSWPESLVSGKTAFPPGDTPPAPARAPVSPASLLRQAKNLDRLGNAKAASTYYHRLVDDYPDTTEADTARERLKALEQE